RSPARIGREAPIASDSADLRDVDLDRRLQGVRSGAADDREGVLPAQDPRRDEEMELVHVSSGEEGAEHGAAALDEDRGELARSEVREDVRDRDALLARGNDDHAALLERLPAIRA